MHVLQHRCIHQNSMQQHALQEVHLHYSTVQYCTIHYTGKHCPQHVPPACLQGAVDEASDHEACLLGPVQRLTNGWDAVRKWEPLCYSQPFGSAMYYSTLLYSTVRYSVRMQCITLQYCTVLAIIVNTVQYALQRERQSSVCGLCEAGWSLSIGSCPMGDGW